jgi:hypothetical protein
MWCRVERHEPITGITVILPVVSRLRALDNVRGGGRYGRFVPILDAAVLLLCCLIGSASRCWSSLFRHGNQGDVGALGYWLWRWPGSLLFWSGLLADRGQSGGHSLPMDATNELAKRLANR